MDMKQMLYFVLGAVMVVVGLWFLTSTITPGN